VKRREFITLGGGAAIAWPFMARAQQAAMPVIGLLSASSPASDDEKVFLAAFRAGLSEIGYTDGRNVMIASRYANNHRDQVPELASDFVRQRVAVIVTTGGTATARAAKAVTNTIPIVFAVGVDLVQTGLVASLNHPGSNLTGASLLTSPLWPKRLGFLRQVVPAASFIAVLVNPENPGTEQAIQEIHEAANLLREQVQIFHASSEGGFESVFARFVQQGAGGLLVGNDLFFARRRDQIIALANRYRMPAIYEGREFAVAGGLLSYGARQSDTYRQVGIYAGRILKGERPGDLPVVQPTKFELVINLKTAKVLEVKIPDALLSLADEVIE
jgi:putative ABC transport system substrate-binding protein